MSDCAIVEFKIKIKSDDHEITFKGPKKSLRTLVEIAKLFSQFD